MEVGAINHDINISASSSAGISSIPTSASRTSSRSGVSSMWDAPLPIAEDDPPLSPMLHRFPSTFVPLRRKATSIAEVAFFVPSLESDLRSATVLSATFNMTATIIGGGVLSIPLSCARAGLVPFTILMILSAVTTDFSLYILCSCARRTGSVSFGRVARASFGPIWELITTAVIFFLVVFIVVGLMVLNQGIWSPIVMELIHSARGEKSSPTTMFQDGCVLLVLLICMLPFLLKRDLTSLRHICYVGFFSIAILCAAMVYRTCELNLATHPGTFQSNSKWAASDFGDILAALPIILLAFLCSFNIISVHCSLVDPTRERVKQLIHRAVFLSFLLMYIFGLAGYLWAYDETNGNILLNFEPTDTVIFIGRIGCGVTTLFALPMNLLPCREALLSLVAQIGELRTRKGGSWEEQRRLLAARGDNVENQHSLLTNDSFLALTKSHTMPNSNKVSVSGDHAGFKRKDCSPAATKPGEASELNSTGGITCNEDAIHWAATFGIIVITYISAVLAPGVAIVWDIAGSSMAFLVQFILPAACYIQLKMKWRGKRGVTQHLVQAWALIIFATVGAVLCTAIVIGRLL